jgi:hypothetical protein
MIGLGTFRVDSRPAEGLVYLDTYPLSAEDAMALARQLAAHAQGVRVFRAERYGYAPPPHEGLASFEGVTAPAFEGVAAAAPAPVRARLTKKQRRTNARRAPPQEFGVPAPRRPTVHQHARRVGRDPEPAPYVAGQEGPRGRPAAPAAYPSGYQPPPAGYAAPDAPPHYGYPAPQQASGAPSHAMPTQAAMPGTAPRAPRVAPPQGTPPQYPATYIPGYSPVDAPPAVSDDAHPLAGT